MKHYQNRTTEDDIYALRECFQRECGDKSLETFTLRAEEAAVLLSRHNLSKLKGICEAVGNYVWTQRTDKLRFMSQNDIVNELFKRARVPLPQPEEAA